MPVSGEGVDYIVANPSICNFFVEVACDEVGKSKPFQVGSLPGPVAGSIFVVVEPLSSSFLINPPPFHINPAASQTLKAAEPQDVQCIFTKDGSLCPLSLSLCCGRYKTA